jgi:short-chain fatty acids transporter
MKEDHLYLRLVKHLLPSPFSIAIVLTLVTYLVAWLLTDSGQDTTTPYAIELLGFWEQGFWELLSFSMQMVLILVLGHTLALSSFADRVLNMLTKYCTDTASAAAIVSLISISVSFFNWGLCLIVGAVFARKVGEYAKQHALTINYPLIGAAGYSGLMTWHGGFSGSATLKVAETDHFLVETIGQIPINETILSPMNLTSWALLIVIIPAIFYYLGSKSSSMHLPDFHLAEEKKVAKVQGAERLDHSKLATYALGGIILCFSLYQLISSDQSSLSIINLNYINFVLFGLCLTAHGTIHAFSIAMQKAVSGATGIIIQFPLYAGIMGIMKYSGLVLIFSDFFIQIATPTTFPIFTLLSAAIVNTFVPSGGGQWAVQGPIICNAAMTLGIPVNKAVMALSYGDQLTNMLQPFWALPLLGITQLKAKDILPYSFIVMLVGLLIFTGVLLIF